MPTLDEWIERAQSFGALTEVQVDKITDAVASGFKSEERAICMVQDKLEEAAIKAKERGNGHFKAWSGAPSSSGAQLESARDEYKKCVEIDENNAAGWSNLALVQLKLGCADLALSAATYATNLLWSMRDDSPSVLPATMSDPPALKALHRRGLAHEQCGHLERALVDLTTAAGCGAKVDADVGRVRASLAAQLEGAADAGEDPLAELFDIDDKRLRALHGDKYVLVAATLPKMGAEFGPLGELSRAEQKGLAMENINEAMDKSDRGEHREAIDLAKIGVRMSVLLGDSPSVLVGFTVISAGHLGLRNFKLAFEFARRSHAILQPLVALGEINPEPTPTPPRDGDGYVNGLRHPRSSYSPQTVFVCEAMSALAYGQAYSASMKMAEAVHAYRRAEAALRSLPAGPTACGMLRTVLTNIGNNLAKNQNLEQAQEYYAQARAVGSSAQRGEPPSAGELESAIALRSSQALMLSRQGDDAGALAELADLWTSTSWAPDQNRLQLQVLLLLTNLSPAAAQPEWLERFERLAPGAEQGRCCCICLEALAPSAEAGSKVYITTCHHVLHEHCWQAHSDAAPPGSTVVCPECRHEVIVPTAPTVVTGSGEVVPLRPGREGDDLSAAIARGGASGAELHLPSASPPHSGASPATATTSRRRRGRRS